MWKFNLTEKKQVEDDVESGMRRNEKFLISNEEKIENLAPTTIKQMMILT
jgi:hypothetical protein